MNVPRVSNLLEHIDKVGIVLTELTGHLMVRDKVARIASAVEEDRVSGVARLDSVAMKRYLQNSVWATVGYR